MANFTIPAEEASDSMLIAADRLGVSAIEARADHITFRGEHSRLVVLLADEYAPDNDIALADAVAEIQLEDENL